MVRIAITGGIACGKSLVGEIFQYSGIPVRDADDIVHELMTRGQPVYDKIIDAFGGTILGNDGAIDRAVLGKMVFSNPALLNQLNELVHPAVRDEWTQWLEKQSGHAAAVIIPLLYEVSLDRGWNAVVCVGTSPREQRRRLRERGLSDADADARIRAQMDVARKMELADYVIFNNGSRSLLEQQTKRVIMKILEKQHG